MFLLHLLPYPHESCNVFVFINSKEKLNIHIFLCVIGAKTPECCSYRRSETSYCDGHSVSLINISMPANSLKR